MSKHIVRNRSSITGRFVKPSFAAKHPDTTEREVLKIK
jgi:hypothetical protein